ncbi:MAG: asparagine synthase-related protein [Candidatus Acidiferrales bacterium]
MSVQAGVWNFDGRPVDRELIQEFSASLRQQGPDDESCYRDGPIGFIYRAFHTTSESRLEKQPHISRRGFILTWDGRLDNREDLLAEVSGDLDRSATDVSIVASAFDRWKTDSFRRIVGDWALTIWRPEEKELIFASDFMGVRHIFYHLRSDQIRWSSDITPLVLHTGVKFHVDDEFVAGYLAHNPDGHSTPYREIREVPPGQFVRVRPGQVSVERFWRFSPHTRIRYKTDRDYEEHFRHVFRQAVRRRLRSDSPVLAELSGGLDSSSIVCMADDILAHEGAEAPRLDTLSYYDKTEPKGDDWIYFQKIESKRGRAGIHIDSSKMTKSPVPLEFREFYPFPGALGGSDELYDERPNAVRKSGCRVVLSGLGGDEFMGGIPDPRALLGDLIVQCRLFRLAAHLAAWSLIKRRPWMHLLWSAAVAASPATLAQHLVPEGKLETWYQADFARHTRLKYRQAAASETLGFWLPTRRSLIGGVQAMASNLAKMFAATTVLEETTYPYLDQNVIEFVLATPADQWLRPGERRSLMRRALAGIVPAEVLARRSKQFAARTPAVMLDQHWGEIHAVYCASISSRLGYVEDAELLKIVSDLRAGKTAPLVRVLWTISLEFWLRELARRGLLELPALSEGAIGKWEIPLSA